MAKQTNDALPAELLPPRTLHISLRRAAGLVCYVCGAASPLGYTIRPVHADREHAHTVTLCHACLRTITRDLGHSMEREVDDLLSEVEWHLDDHPRDAEAYLQRIAFLDGRSRELIDLARDPTDHLRDQRLDDVRVLRTERTQRFAELTRLVFAPDIAEELLDVSQQVADGFRALPIPNLRHKQRAKAPQQVVTYRVICEGLITRVNHYADTPDAFGQFVIADILKTVHKHIGWVSYGWRFPKPP